MGIVQRWVALHRPFQQRPILELQFDLSTSFFFLFFINEIAQTERRAATHGSWVEYRKEASIQLVRSLVCSRGELSPCPVALSYFALMNGISVLPSHCASNTGSQRGTGILCTSSGQLICVD